MAVRREQSDVLVFHERLIHKNWLDRAARHGVRPPKDVSELISQLLVTYVEAIPNIEPFSEDIYDVAHELALILLPETDTAELYLVYRDYVLDSIMLAIGPDADASQWQSLVRLSILISNAYSDANSDLLRRTIRRERVELFTAELKAAKAIQRQLLPKVIPSIPGFQFAGRLIPAAEIGGDYWSARHYEEDGIVTLKLADISGHGVAAATLVAAVKFISGCYYRRSDSAAEVMEHTNRILTRETPHDILISMVYGWLRPLTRQLTIVNAGHDPVYICRSDSCSSIAPTGPVLGVVEPVKYGETTFDLHEGDMVFFGSDGIVEAGVGQPYGTDRLKDLLSKSMHLTADQIADTVIQSVRDYTAQPHDDISMLVTKVTGTAVQ